jgi:hypothetical protein
MSKNWRTVAVVLSLLFTSSACAHFRVAPGNLSQATEPEERRVRTVGWGITEPLVVPSNCNGQGLATVMVTVRPRDTFIAIVTLGIVRPVIIEWTCAKERGAR